MHWIFTRGRFAPFLFNCGRGEQQSSLMHHWLQLFQCLLPVCAPPSTRDIVFLLNSFFFWEWRVWHPCHFTLALTERKSGTHAKPSWLETNNWKFKNVFCGNEYQVQRSRNSQEQVLKKRTNKGHGKVGLRNCHRSWVKLIWLISCLYRENPGKAWISFRKQGIFASFLAFCSVACWFIFLSRKGPQWAFQWII